MGTKNFPEGENKLQHFLKERGGGKSKGVEEEAKLQETRGLVFSDKVLMAGKQVRSKL